MKFFIDENLPPLLTSPLQALFRDHCFRASEDEGLIGALDIPLFSELRIRGFDAIITKDSKQVVANDPERRALFDHKLHWIGVTQLAEKGLPLIAAWTASITAALPHVLRRAADQPCEPSWFKVVGIGVQADQRVKVGPLWRTHWDRPS